MVGLPHGSATDLLVCVPGPVEITNHWRTVAGQPGYGYRDRVKSLGTVIRYLFTNRPCRTSCLLPDPM